MLKCCGSSKLCAMVWMVPLMCLLMSTSLTVADNDVHDSTLHHPNNQARPPKATLDSINKRLDLLFGRDRNTQKTLNEIHQRFIVFENTTKEQAEMIAEFRQLNNNLSIVVSNIIPDLEQHKSSSSKDDLSDLINLLTTTQSEVHQNHQDMQLISERIQEVLVSTEAIKNELEASKIQQIFTSNEAFVQQPQLPHSIPHEFALPIGCDSIPPLGENGIYRIKSTAESVKPFYAFCLANNDQTKWTVILNRVGDDTSFFRGWADYKLGFGNINKSFWMGLERIHEITSSRLHELLVILEDFEGNQKQAKYSMFAVADEEHGYTLEILGAYSGNAGDSLSYHAGQKFSTFDQDNDNWQDGNCALSHTGGWWYDKCDKTNLCGLYLGTNLSSETQYQGVYWDNFHGPEYSLKRVQMMIRPAEI